MIEAIYANQSKAQFPSPLELIALCALVPVAALVRFCRWTYVTVVNLGPVVPVVAFLTLGALSIFLGGVMCR